MSKPEPIEILRRVSFWSTFAHREKPVTRWLKQGGRYPYPLRGHAQPHKG